MEDTEINPRILEWFEARGIGPETVMRTGIYSGRHHKTGGDTWEVRPDPTGNLIVYPFFRGGVVVNEKYRDAQKRFYQKPNGRKVFWNADILEDPSLQDGSHALLITEGENDALAAIEAGHPFVVSVPDGAPPPRKEPLEPLDQIDPEHDDKFSFIFNDWDALKKIKRVVIAADNDEPGKRLAEELVRRLGRVRCSFVTYPENCKDLNDVLLHLGAQTVLDTIYSAKPYPVSGIYTFDDLPPEPDLQPLSTGWGRLDHLIRPFFPSFMVVTGTANAGKSTWVTQLVTQMSYLHNLKVGLTSFEMRINPFVTDTIKSAYREIGGRNDPERWINSNFVFVCPEPSDEDQQFDIHWLIEKAEAAVIRYGIRIFVIDPWNEIEHSVGRRESVTEYTGKAIRALKRFGREFECLVIVVAHPSKAGAAKAEHAEAIRKIKEKNPDYPEEPERLTLYDISDTAHFANKADFGAVLTRVGRGLVTEVSIVKVRYQPDTGTIGETTICFDQKNKIFGQ